MTNDQITWLSEAIPAFYFGYPFVAAWYWMAGGIMYYRVRERMLPPLDQPPDLGCWPPISILVPCYNEAANAEETFAAANAVDYPDFEVIAVNDGSQDDSGAVLDAIAAKNPRMRVLHLEQNQGKATALIAGALLAKNEILVCIDGDALLDPHCLRWIAPNFRHANLGALTGNPRIRNRSTLLGHLQVGEYSCTVGLIKRAQATYGRMFTISGVMCAFRKRALADAGWWSPRTVTEDVDVSWRIQMAGWRITYEPNAVCWILMPETLRGLWRQRLRWAQGGSQMMIDFFRPVLRGHAPGLALTYLNFVVSVLWAYAIVAGIAFGLLRSTGLVELPLAPVLNLIPEWWGVVLSITYLMQAMVSYMLERRYESGTLQSMLWVIWYPLAYWLISAMTTVVGLPLALKPRRERTTWVSPDRGLR